MLAGASPAMGQDGAFGNTANSAFLDQLMEEMAQADPLTAEQEARIPLADIVVAQVLPDGIYGRIISQSLNGVLAPMLQALPTGVPVPEMASLLGVEEARLANLDPEVVEQIGTMLDPAFDQRQQIYSDLMLARMGGIMERFEPGMRKGMSRAFAQRFNEAELRDIASFFSTPTGARYASESMLLFSDPQTMAGMMESLPAMMEALPDVMVEMEQAAASLPRQRNVAELSAKERAAVAAALGVSVTELPDGAKPATRK